MTAEAFVSRPEASGSAGGRGQRKYGPSHYQLLQETVASWLQVPVDNVQVFTVLNHPTQQRTIDVRYSVHGSPYYRPTKLNGIMAQRKALVSLASSLSSSSSSSTLLLFRQFLHEHTHQQGI